MDIKLKILSPIVSLGAFVVLSLTQPSPAQAQSRQVQLLLDNQSNQNFQTLLQQAESVAKNSIEQSFAEDPNLKEVSVTVVGEHNGAVVPLLSTNVSRSNWLGKPTIQAWSQYFSTAEVLLGFLKPQPTTATAPTTTFDPVAASMVDKEASFY